MTNEVRQQILIDTANSYFNSEPCDSSDVVRMTMQFESVLKQLPFPVTCKAYYIENKVKMSIRFQSEEGKNLLFNFELINEQV